MPFTNQILIQNWFIFTILNPWGVVSLIKAIFITSSLRPREESRTNTTTTETTTAAAIANIEVDNSSTVFNAAPNRKRKGSFRPKKGRRLMISKLEALPDDVLFNIVEFTGAQSCYRGCGAVCKRINQLFKTHPYSNKLSKSTSYGGYAPSQDIVQKCKAGLEKGIRYESWKILHILASGVVTFNRTDLLFWTIETQNKHVFHAICERAIRDRKLFIMEKVWGSIQDKSLMAYMKRQTSFIRVAAGKGNLDILKDLREKLKCEWDGFACSWAAANGHLDCLMYLHKNNCPWDKSACEWAAKYGHLDCLVYLHKKGCPWNEGACEYAAENNHLDCLQYMRDNGLEWDRYDEYLHSTK